MNHNNEFETIIKDILDNKKFNKLKKEKHHGITRYEHSLRVAEWTYKVSKFLKINKIENITRASLLHDFYTDNDLKGQSSPKKLNTHPSKALENSLKYFELSEKDKDIIESHMFPCTLRIPKYKESWLVSLIDKSVSTYEMLRYKAPLYACIYLIFIFELIKNPR